MKPRQANHKKFAVLESRGPSGLSSQGIIQPYLHQQKYLALGQWVTTRNRKGELCILHSMMSPRSYILINDLCLAKELKETHTLIFIRGKTKWPSGLVLTLRSKARCTSAVLYESKFMLRAFLPSLWKKKKNWQEPPSVFMLWKSITSALWFLPVTRWLSLQVKLKAQSRRISCLPAQQNFVLSITHSSSNAKVNRPECAHAGQKQDLVFLPGVLSQQGEQMEKSAKFECTKTLLHQQHVTYLKIWPSGRVPPSRITVLTSLYIKKGGKKQAWYFWICSWKEKFMAGSLESQFAAVTNKWRVIHVTVSPIVLMILVMKNRWLLTSVIWHTK